MPHASSLLRLSRSKRRRDEGPLPAASAGLLRFFEEETPGIKVRPEVVMIMVTALISVSIVILYTLK